MSKFALPFSRSAWLMGVLVASFYPLLGLKRAFSLIGIGLAVYGLVLIFRRGRELLESPAIRASIIVAAGFALPLLLSLIDAAFPAVSIAATGTSLLYLPILVAVIVLVQEQRIARPLLILSVATTLLWVLDGIIQLAFGRDIFGMTYNGERIGAYWQNQMKFGYYMGFYGLFAVAALAVLKPNRPILLASFWVVIAVGVLIGGSREAWIMFFAFSGVLFWVHVASQSRYRWLLLIGGLVLAVLLAAVAYKFSPTVHDRVAQSVIGFQWDYEAIDKASSRRLELWRIALEMIEAHPINGQGLDSYQNLFSSLVRQPMWMGLAEGPYPHQYLLEVGSATGVLGWLGLLMIAVVVCRSWRQALPEQRAMAWPALIYLMALWFPLNTHRSFYSSELIMGNLLMMGFILGNLLPIRQPAYPVTETR